MILTNCRIIAGSLDLTCVSNQIEVAVEAEEADVTSFCSGGWRDRIAGLKNVTANVSGFFDALTATDSTMFAQLGSAHHTSFCPDTTAAGGTAYFCQSMEGAYQWGAKVGEVQPMSATFAGKGGYGLVQGLSLQPVTTAVTAAGTGTSVLFPAVAATQTMHALLHVTSLVGGTLTVVAHSDTAGTFPSTTPAGTFTAATGATSQWLSFAGANTDTYWRLVWTLTGGTAYFTVLAGIT